MLMLYSADCFSPDLGENGPGETGTNGEAVYIIYPASDTEEKEGTHASCINLSSDYACGDYYLVLAAEKTGI